MIEHVKLAAARAVAAKRPRVARSRSAMRPGNGHALHFQRRQRQLQPHACRMSGSLPTQAPLHLPTCSAKHEPSLSSSPSTLRQSCAARAMSVERLAGVLLGMKYAETLREIVRFQHCRWPLRCAPAREAPARLKVHDCALLLGVPVVARLLRLDPVRLEQHRAKFAGGLHANRRAAPEPPAVDRCEPGVVGGSWPHTLLRKRVAPADVQQRTVLAVKSIDARTFGQLVGQTRRQLRGQLCARRAWRAPRPRKSRPRQLAPQFAPQIVQHPGIAQAPGAGRRS